MRGSWQTTDSGGAGPVLWLIGAAVLVAAIAGPVVAIVAAVARLVVIVVIAVVVLAVAAVVLRWRVTPAAAVAFRQQIHRPAPRAVPAAQPRALPPAREVHIHHHWHVAPETVAELLRDGEGWTS